MFQTFNVEVSKKLRIEKEHYHILRKLLEHSNISLVSIDYENQLVILKYGREVKSFSIYELITMYLPPVLFNNHFRYLKHFYNALGTLLTFKNKKSPSTIRRLKKELAEFNITKVNKFGNTNEPKIRDDQESPHILETLFSLFKSYKNSKRRNKPQLIF